MLAVGVFPRSIEPFERMSIGGLGEILLGLKRLV